jgi:hypothetical protein
MEQTAHAFGGFIAALVAGLLVSGWRDRARIDLSFQLAALFSMFVGLLFGVAWELVEFVLDWMRDANLQPSNTSSLVDMLWTDVGAVLGGVLVGRAYCHWLTAHRREALGGLAEWLVDGPSRVLDRHGFLITITVSLALAGAVATLWFVGRPVPGFSTN